MWQKCSKAFRVLHPVYVLSQISDKAYVGGAMRDEASANLIRWAIQMRATSIDEPAHLVQTLTGAILGCGGWVLSRGATDTGVVKMLFEFDRSHCIDMYIVLIAAGVELSRGSHIRFTELCQCALLTPCQGGTQITTIDLEIVTSPAKELEETASQSRA